MWLREHARRVASISRRVGEVLGLTPKTLRVLTAAALTHDTGKLFLPRALLLKRGPLNRRERLLVRQHPLWGARLLSSLEGGLGPLAQTALFHHERWDGSGYPLGLVGERIPLFARIVAVADTYDAIVSEKPYKPPKSPEEALREIQTGKGSLFDPVVVDAFVEVFGKWNQAFPFTVT